MIGVFDSGLGGLIVLDHLAQKYPEHRFLFHPDRDNAPFGNKSDEELKRIFNDNLIYFKAHNCQELVVACNTLCSTIDFSEYQGIKIYDIISKTVDQIKVDTNAHILVLATAKTIEKGRYQSLLKTKGYNNVTAVALPQLASMIESYQTDEDVKEYLIKELVDIQKVDVIILGCTHYPCVIHIFNSLFDAKIYDSNNLDFNFNQEYEPADILLDLKEDDGLKLFMNRHISSDCKFL